MQRLFHCCCLHPMREHPPVVAFHAERWTSAATSWASCPACCTPASCTHLWQNGILEGRHQLHLRLRGSDVTACDLWSKVIASSGGDRPGEARLMTLQQRALLRTRHTRDRIAESTGRTAHGSGVWRRRSAVPPRSTGPWPRTAAERLSSSTARSSRPRRRPCWAAPTST